MSEQRGDTYEEPEAPAEREKKVMASFNRVTLLGRLTRDTETKYLQSGTAVCEIGLAINQRVKKGDEWVEEPVFVDVTLWGKTAETAGEYLRKGSQVLIDGRLKLDSWTDADSGQKRSKLRVIGQSMQMLGAPGSDGNGQATDENAGELVAASVEGNGPGPDDEAPF